MQLLKMETTDLMSNYISYSLIAGVIGKIDMSSTMMKERNYEQTK